MVKFLYSPNAAIQQLINETIVDVPDPSSIVGYIDDTDSTSLAHCSLFLICTMEFNDKLVNPIYSNPHVIVAKNDGTALDIFYRMTKHDNGSVVSILETRCDKLKVSPC